MHPKNLSIKDYTYDLPEEKIAKFPLPERDQAKLLIYNKGEIKEDFYAHIASHLPEHSLLVFNDTRVIAARLLFQKTSGGIIEIFILGLPDQSAMYQTEKVLCKCLIGGASKWKHGQVMQKLVAINGTTLTLKATIVKKLEDNFAIEFTWQPGSYVFEEVLGVCGVMPIPPYLKRDAEASDNVRYQTIFARHNGSVAAPTAGLHFTPEICKSCKENNIEIDFITLHVGAGTFMPVKSSMMQGHEMHAEFLVVEPGIVRNLIKHPENVFAVGTTSLRTLESIYWMGVKCFLKPDISLHDLEIKQWEVYDELGKNFIKLSIALQSLLDWMTRIKVQTLVIKTQILIAPGYQPKIIRGLITNFHQPDSTLLLLVAALIGDDWHKVYAYALKNNFRFLSYGDGSLLFLH